MGQYSKGSETKSGILLAARQLFYERGYQQTSVRDIANASGANLGLIQYHFGSKSALALELYASFRNELNSLAEAQGIAASGTCTFFLFCNMVELAYGIRSKPFGRFFAEIMREPDIRQYYQKRIIARLRMYNKREVDEVYYQMTCVAIAAMKPALIDWAIGGAEPVEGRNVVEYYLGEYIHFLGESAELHQTILTELTNYHFDVGERFTPILTRLAGASTALAGAKAPTADTKTFPPTARQGDEAVENTTGIRPALKIIR
ncbi:MAG: TetR/AcrR family transcriptional regulator [Clostridiales bacterium]|jgi:AcrR family transcriptional regulator|nr:TetR/AcrR family transcriptional regulator [Clostridiales bacterium]